MQTVLAPFGIITKLPALLLRLGCVWGEGLEGMELCLDLTFLASGHSVRLKTC